MLHGADGGWDKSYWVLPSDFNHYKGSTLADAVMGNMNDGLVDTRKDNINLI